MVTISVHFISARGNKTKYLISTERTNKILELMSTCIRQTATSHPKFAHNPTFIFCSPICPSVDATFRHRESISDKTIHQKINISLPASIMTGD